MSRNDEKFKELLNSIGVDASEGIPWSGPLYNASNGEAGVLLVFREGCGHCKKFKPEFVSFYDTVQKWNEKNSSKYKPFKVWIMDSDVRGNIPFMDAHNINTVPYVALISKSGTLSKYEGERKAEKILNHLLSLKVDKK
jgi:hypothetical protein